MDRSWTCFKERDNPCPSAPLPSKPRLEDNQSEMTCYRCGQKGHIASNPICPKYEKKPPAQMFATRTVVDDRSNEEHVVK